MLGPGHVGGEARQRRRLRRVVVAGVRRAAVGALRPARRPAGVARGAVAEPGADAVRHALAVAAAAERRRREVDHELA